MAGLDGLIYKSYHRNNNFLGLIQNVCTLASGFVNHLSYQKLSANSFKVNSDVDF